MRQRGPAVEPSLAHQANMGGGRDRVGRGDAETLGGIADAREIPARVVDRFDLVRPGRSIAQHVVSSAGVAIGAYLASHGLANLLPLAVVHAKRHRAFVYIS